jgi:hypothetical protein
MRDGRDGTVCEVDTLRRPTQEAPKEDDHACADDRRRARDDRGDLRRDGGSAEAGPAGRRRLHFHAGGPNPGGGWRVVEVWESEAEAQKWFEANVEPNLSPGIKPNRSYHELHTAFTG